MEPCGLYQNSILHRRRETRIAFRASTYELEELKRRASANNCTISGYIRLSLANVPIIPISPPSMPELRVAARLAKISSGLTYLLRLCEHNHFSLGDTRQTIGELQAVMSDLAMQLRERQ